MNIYPIRKRDDIMIIKLPKKNSPQQKFSIKQDLCKMFKPAKMHRNHVPFLQKHIDHYVEAQTHQKICKSDRIKTEPEDKNGLFSNELQKKCKSVKYNLGTKKFPTDLAKEYRQKNMKSQLTLHNLKSSCEHSQLKERASSIKIILPKIQQIKEKPVEKVQCIHQKYEHCSKAKEVLRIKLKPKPKINPKLFSSAESKGQDLNKMIEKINKKQSSENYLSFGPADELRGWTKENTFTSQFSSDIIQKF